MKIVIFLLTIICFLSGGFLFAKGDVFILRVNIKGVSSGKAVIAFPFTDNKVAIKDTVVISKGSFSFSGKIDAPALSSVTILPQKIRFEVFIEKGKIEVAADTSKKNKNKGLILEVNGSQSHREYELVSSFFRAQIDSVYDLYLREKDEKRKIQLHKDMEVFQDKNKAKVVEYIESHLNSAVSAYYLIFNTNDNYTEFKKLEKIFNGLGPVAKASVYYERIKKDFDDISLIQPGKTAPDFTLNTPDGKSLSLNSLKGKYLLIDFWASWCVPCRESFPKMKEIYSKYHDKGFEILGVSDDSKKEAWLKALTDDKLPWLQVIDEFPVKNKPARVGTLYATHYIPTTILLDKEGKIIAKNLHDAELLKKLDELLAK